MAQTCFFQTAWVEKCLNFTENHTIIYCLIDHGSVQWDFSVKADLEESMSFK